MQVSLLKQLPDHELFRYLSKCFAGRAMEYVSNSVYSVCLLAAQVPRTPHMRATMAALATAALTPAALPMAALVMAVRTLRPWPRSLWLHLVIT